MNLKSRVELKENLVTFIKNNYLPEEKVTTSKDGSKTTFFRKGGKSLCYIAEKDERFVVTVVIGTSLNEKVQSSSISKKAKEMFKQAKQFHDGKWLFFEVKSSQDLEDIRTLLAIKRFPVKI